ncbi:hypothetical protein AMV154 [Betaentomopoxvirus amoorei]|uniref:AMV154 n=1 Tax=Amsacta moorei entomopoxvirus TaxID=28321 RepID=Q9EMP5_AMEPV|nr:hypothetical protein AMV154 [Amsacta moorei entomopoxvirus]AAG02860.1 AMV154 [Amsacta moorei entomopoxvirus]
MYMIYILISHIWFHFKIWFKIICFSYICNIINNFIFKFINFFYIFKVFFNVRKRKIINNIIYNFTT